MRLSTRNIFALVLIAALVCTIGASNMETQASESTATFLGDPPEGFVVKSPVVSYSTTSAAPHHLLQVWVPTGGDPAAVTGSIVVGGASPFGSGIGVASIFPTDVVLFGFLPILIQTGPGTIVNQGTFNYDGGGQVVVPNVTRDLPGLAGFHVYTQFFEISPLVLSSNGLDFQLAADD